MTEMKRKVKEGRPTRKLGGWFRLYTEILDDPKVQLLPDRLFKLWVNLLSVASTKRGTLPTARELSFRLRIPLSEAEDDIASLINHGLIDWVVVDGKKVLQPHNWFAWQPPRTVSTERVRRFRKRHRAGGETPRNAIETVSETLGTYSTSTVATATEKKASQDETRLGSGRDRSETVEGLSTGAIVGGVSGLRIGGAP